MNGLVSLQVVDLSNADGTAFLSSQPQNDLSQSVTVGLA